MTFLCCLRRRNVFGPGFGVDGDAHMFEFGKSYSFGDVDGDMNIVGLGRSSGLGNTGEETNLLGLHRSSRFGSYNEQNFNSHAITPFHSDGMHGGLCSRRPISLIGNTRRMGHGDDLSMVMSPNGICRVCEYVVSGFRCPQCTVCNQVHPDCCTQFGMDVAVCHRCVGERNRHIDCQRAQTTHRVATDLGRSAVRNPEIAGNVIGVSAASTVKAVVGLGRSAVRGMSSVMQGDNNDERERT